MEHYQIRPIVTGTALGALLGMAIGFFVSQTKKEQLQLMTESDDIEFKPTTMEWIGLVIASVTLIRHLINVMTPKQKKRFHL
jgi:membrane protein YqaA with SNARE-associated domain